MSTPKFETTWHALLGTLHAAGIDGSVVAVPNEYWPEHTDYDDVRSPWMRVYTTRGVLRIGWRKRVIVIDWSDSVIEVDGADVVAEDWITHDGRMCHAYGYTQAAGCLTRLWARRLRDGGGA